MWGRGALRAIAIAAAVAAVGTIAVAVATAVVSSVVNSTISGFGWPMLTIIFVSSIALLGGAAAVEKVGARRQGVAAFSPVPADEPIDVLRQALAGVPRPGSVGPDSGVAYRPALRPPAAVATCFSVGWLGVGLATYDATVGRWSAEPCHRSDPYYDCANDTDLALALLFGVVIFSVLAFITGWHGWRMRRLRPARLSGLDSDPADADVGLLGAIGTAILTSLCFFPGIWSAIVGATRYADSQPLVAVRFGLTVVGVVVLLAAWARTGYVASLRNAAKWVALDATRHYPNPPTPPTPPTPTAAEWIVESVTRRALRRHGKAAPGFEPDPWVDLLDKLSLTPSVRTFTLAGRITVVVAHWRVAVLACVNWPPGRYARHGELSVTRDGQPYRDPGNAVAGTVKALQWLSRKGNLPARAVVRAFIVVTTEIGGAVEFDNGTDWLRLVRAVEAEPEISAFLAVHPGVIDRGVALAVWRAGPNLNGYGFNS